MRPIPDDDYFALKICMDCGAALSDLMEKWKAAKCGNCNGDGGLISEKGVGDCLICHGTGLVLA